MRDSLIALALAALAVAPPLVLLRLGGWPAGPLAAAGALALLAVAGLLLASYRLIDWALGAWLRP